MINNLFYFRKINSIGGVETFFYNLAKKYSNLDIVIYYQQADVPQLNRLKKHVNCKKYNGEKIRCKKAFFNYNTDIIDKIEADEYIMILHADYSKLNVKPNTHPKITKFIGVSDLVRTSFMEMTGYPCEVSYNPISVEKPKKILKLISATRLTIEKGKDRIIKLANALENKGISFIWTIYTNDLDAILNDNIIFRKPRLDISSYIADSDYLVQLSDCEGYCYSVIESLMLGTPVIVTDCPVFKELGIKDKEHGFVLDFKMENIPIDEIVKGIKKVSYSPPEDSWNRYLVKGESQYKKDLKTETTIKCIVRYFDLEKEKEIQVGELINTNKVRAEFLIENGVAESIRKEESNGII